MQTTGIATERLAANADGIRRAAALLGQGGLVAFPTETVYGLGADARNATAVARIYEAKGRPTFNPLIVHLPSLEAAREIAIFNDTAERLAASFWPGALTLVLPLRPAHGLSSLVTAGLSSVALRVPGLELARDLLVRAKCPVAAPSANPSGRLSPTSAAHVLAGLDGRIEAVLDNGPAAVGVESSIVGLVGAPTLLRPGGVPVEALQACLGARLVQSADAVPASTPTAPGQLASHYAPRAPVRLNATEAGPGERLLGFGPGNGAPNLSPAGDLREAAANLFTCLHRLDLENDAPIAVAPIPETGLGRAINDRLRRAAAPRA